MSRLALLGLGLSLLSGCTLIQRPEPLTTVQLSLADADLAWPVAIAPANVEATSALRSNRVLVIDGAVLMQHEGLRWVDTPVVMLADQLRVMHARTRESTSSIASLDLWLSEFNVRVEADRSREVAVSAHGTLRCTASDRSIAIAPASARTDRSGDDPQALADAFARASAEVLKALLSEAATSSAGCAQP